MTTPYRLRLRLFGAFRASIEGLQPLQITAPRHQALLAYLALQPGLSETRERLATLLWGDCLDRQARHSLRQSLLTLRKDLEAAGLDILQSDRATVSLDADLVGVDVRDFRILAASEAEADLQRACALYDGDLLDGLSLDLEGFDDWLLGQRADLRLVAALLFERCAQLNSRPGNAQAAIACAERLVALDAAHEPAHRLLIELLARHRGATAALTYASAFERSLHDEFGTEPETPTRELIDNIRSNQSNRASPILLAEEGAPRNGTGQDRPIDAADNPMPSAVAAAALGDQASSKPIAARRYPRWTRLGTAVLVVAAAVGALRLATTDSSSVPAMPATMRPDAGWQSPTAGIDPAISKAIGGGNSPIIVLPIHAEGPEDGPTRRLARRISTELIGTLSRVPGFRVIAQSTSAHYGRRPVDIAALGGELGVHYAVEGDLRMEEEKLRLDVALVDVRTRLRLWTERYDGEAPARAAALDDIARSMARRLQITRSEQRGRPSGNVNPTLDELLGRGWAAYNRFNLFRGGEEAEQLFRDALRLEPDNVSALTGLGAVLNSAAFKLPTNDERKPLIEQAETLLRRAIELDPFASLAYYFLGSAAVNRGEPADALAYYAKTLEFNPSYAPAYAQIGLLQFRSGRPHAALEHVHYAMRLSPRDHNLGLWCSYAGMIYFEIGNDAEAERWLTQYVRLMPNSPRGQAILAGFYAETGRWKPAQERLAEAYKLAPKLSYEDQVSRLLGLTRQTEHRPERLIAGMRKAFGVSH